MGGLHFLLDEAESSAVGLELWGFSCSLTETCPSSTEHEFVSSNGSFPDAILLDGTV
jgi:hypothetical protein